MTTTPAASTTRTVLSTDREILLTLDLLAGRDLPDDVSPSAAARLRGIVADHGMILRGALLDAATAVIAGETDRARLEVVGRAVEERIRRTALEAKLAGVEELRRSGIYDDAEIERMKAAIGA